jgi:MFS family permease
LIVGAYNACYFLSSYIFGYLSDHFGGKKILHWGLLFAAVCFLLQIFAHDVRSLFLLRSLVGFGAGIFPAALAVYAYSENKGKMNSFVGLGSLGWAFGSIMAGVTANNHIIFGIAGALFTLAFWLSFNLKINYAIPKKVSIFPRTLIWRNARIYVSYFWRALGAQAVWSIFPLYLMWTGADKLWVGIAYFINTGVQFLIMQFLDKYPNLRLVRIGLFSSILTFAGYAFFPHIAIVLFLQLLLAFSFATLQVGAMSEILEQNVEQATAVGILNAIINFTAVIGPFLAGFIAESFGFIGVMWFAVFCCSLGLLFFASVLN